MFNITLSQTTHLPNEKTKAWAQLSLTAPQSITKGDKRKALDLILVIDKSYSMKKADAIGQACKAARQLIDRLGPDDRVGVISFSGTPHLHCELTKNHISARASIDQISCDWSGTNLASGLYMAQDLVKQNSKERIPYVILLSDGEANVGDCLATTILPKLSSSVRFTTMGLGESYDEVLLEAIAEATGGNYYYVQGADRLQAAFTEELGELQGITLVDAKVVWKPASGVKITRVLGPAQSIDPKSGELMIGDMSAGSTRELIVELEFKTGKDGSNKKVLEASCVATGEKDEAVENGQVAKVAVSKDADACMASVNADVLMRLAQLESAWAQTQAATWASQGNFNQARVVVEQVNTRITAYENLAPVHAKQHLSSMKTRLTTTTETATTGLGFSGLTSKMMRTESYNSRNNKGH